LKLLLLEVESELRGEGRLADTALATQHEHFMFHRRHAMIDLRHIYEEE